MKDEDKTKEQLLEELAALRQTLAEAKASAKDRKQVPEKERTLQESEKRYRQIVDLAQEGIWTIDGSAEALTTFVNPQMARMLGYDQHEMIGRSVFSFMDSTDREIAQQNIASRKEVTPEERDFVFIKKDGSRIFASVSAAPILDEKGNHVGGVAIISDITKRRQMEEALRESEARYQAIVEDQTELVCRFLPDGTVTFINEAYCRYFSTTRERMIGSSLKPFLSDQTRQQLEELWSSLSQENAVATIEQRLEMPDGQVRWQQWISHGIFNQQGHLKEIQAVGRDVTKRKRVEEMLRESEERYHSMFEKSGTATFIIEEDMTISMANIECEKLTGYSREEIVGKNKWTEFVVPEDLKRMKKYHYQRREKGGVASSEYEFRFVDKKGIFKDIFLKVAMIPGTKKSIASLMDITTRKRAEEKIRGFPRRLIGAIEEERKAIAQNLHDECGGNLTSLRFGLDDLEISKQKGSEKKKIDRLKEIIKKLAENVQKISSDLRPETLDHLGLIPALKGYIKELNARISGLQINFQSTGFKKRLKAELEIVLFRVIQEGLTNVIKHAKAKRVDILLAFNHPQIILSIKDDGDGFEEQENRTLEGGRKRGIGLWSMRERVASVGGTIHIRSRKGKGTVIRAELPAGAREKDAKN